MAHNSSLTTLRVDEIGVTSNFTGVEEMTPLRAELEKRTGEFKQPPLSSSRRPLGRRQIHPAFDVMRWLCVILHLAVIAVLVYLVTRPIQPHFEGLSVFLTPRIPLDDTAEDALNHYTKTGLGYIVTAVIALLTLTTQRLALRRQLHLYNTLTAKHDANSAWLGVASAGLTLLQWRDIGFKAALSSTVFPLLYLGTLAALHSVTTSMVTLVPFPVSKTLIFQSNGLPDFSQASIDNAFTGSSALLTILSLNTFDFTGLGSDGLGVIYDIPISENKTAVRSLPVENINVNATYFNVTCGMLDGSITETNTNAGYEFFINNDTQLALQIPAPFSQNSVLVRTAPWGAGIDSTSDLSLWPSTIVVLSTVPIRDSFNRKAQTVSVNPPMTYTPFNSTDQQTTHEIVALGCNLTMQSLPQAIIDKATFALINSTATNKTSSTLSPFPPEVRQSLLDLDNASDALNYAWGILPMTSVSPLVFSLQNNCFASNNSLCEPLYEAEQFVMESLNIFPDILLGQSTSAQSAPNIALVDLENVLSRMSAIEIWAESFGNNQKFANALSLEGQEGSANTDKLFVQNQNRVVYAQMFLVFGIWRSSVIAALALAIFLLVLASPSILDNNNLKIDSVGILQMIYLINRHPELHRSIADIDDPSVATLRREGSMQPFCFDDKKRKSGGLNDAC